MKRNLLFICKGAKSNFLHWRLLTVFLFIFAISASAQSPVRLEAAKSITEVKESNFQTLKVQYAFDELHTLEVKTEHGTFNELMFQNAYSVGELGTPKLPAAKNLIEIPFGATVEVSVKSYTTTEYKLADYGIKNALMPVQPSIRKDQQPEDVPFEFQPEAYAKSNFTEREIAEVEVLGVMRGMRLARLVVSPVQYNPSTGTIRAYNNIELEVSFKNADMELTQYIKASTWSPYFQVLETRVLNPLMNRDIFDDHPDLTKNPIKMLIVSHREFEETLEPYIEWKTQMGFYVQVDYTDEIGTTAAAIQSHIHGVYNAATPEDPAPTFVILVGDGGKVPASAIGSSSNVVTDLYYASVDGDYFPEMYHGRLSARNVQELQNQIDKILYYEKYEFDDPSYLDDVTLIAGQDGTWNPRIGQPTVHYATQNYFNAAHGFNNVNAYLNSYSGCYDNDRISVSFINFTAHCSSTSWAGPYLTVTNVHNMTNTGKYPLAIGNCCQSSLFSHPESIGEAWVRAANKGAVAYIGSAPNSYWFEDFYWAVGAFPLQGTNNGYVPTAEETTLGAYDAPFVSDYLAVGAMKFVGNLAVTEVDVQNYPSHSSPLYYWQAYHTFGDPSTFIYKTQGSDNEVSHLPILPIGLDTYTVEALPGSYVAISKDGVLHGAAFVDESGEVEVPIQAVLDGGDVMIVVTKSQFIPYIQIIPAAALEGPFVVLDHYDIDGQPTYNETISLDVTIKNVGADPVGTVTATLTGTDPYITIINPGTVVEFDGMQAGETGNTSFMAGAFELEISKNVPNNHQATFALSVTDGTSEWVSNLRITAFAPVFSINPDYTMDEDGDGNGRLDPGESAVLTFMVTNNGGATALNPAFEITGNSPYLTIENENQELPALNAGETTEVTILVHAHGAAAEGTSVDLDLNIEDGHFFATQTELIIGQVPEMQVGNGTGESVQYPFYNYWKANRSQMLYLNSELGAGEKVMKKLGFNITQVADNYKDLPNFKILVKHVDISQMPASFVDMSDATEVFSADVYSMPDNTGWHIWDIEDFVYDGESNLMVEVIWGQLDHWTFTFYKVATTTMPNAMVSFGYSDSQVVPGYNGNSTARPNLHISFQAEETEPSQTITFIAKNPEMEALEEAAIKIGSYTMLTNEAGEVQINLFPGNYLFSAMAKEFDDIVGGAFSVGSEPLTIEVIFGHQKRYAHFVITDTYGNEVEDAVITCEGNEHNPGEYLIDDLEPGAYQYTITRSGYFDKDGSFEITDHNLELHVTLVPDGTFIESVSEQDVRIFPNPTTGRVNVRMNGFNSETSVRLTNYHGQTLQTRIMNPQGGENQFNIDLGNYSAGIYYLRIDSRDIVIIKKIVLQ